MKMVAREILKWTITYQKAKYTSIIDNYLENLKTKFKTYGCLKYSQY